MNEIKFKTFDEKQLRLWDSHQNEHWSMKSECKSNESSLACLSWNGNKRSRCEQVFAGKRRKKMNIVQWTTYRCNCYSHCWRADWSAALAMRMSTEPKFDLDGPWTPGRSRRLYCWARWPEYSAGRHSNVRGKQEINKKLIPFQSH